MWGDYLFLPRAAYLGNCPLEWNEGMWPNALSVVLNLDRKSWGKAGSNLVSTVGVCVRRWREGLEINVNIIHRTSYTTVCGRSFLIKQTFSTAQLAPNNLDDSLRQPLSNSHIFSAQILSHWFLSAFHSETDNPLAQLHREHWCEWQVIAKE